MSEEVTNLVPPLTPEQLAQNAAFQAEMRGKFTFPITLTPNKYDTARLIVADELNVLTILQDQFEKEEDDEQKKF